MDSPVEVDVAEWEGKLVGKTLIPIGGTVTDPDKQFAQADINVAKIRVLTPKSAMTMDYWPDRLNIFVEEDSMVVTKVTSG